jgi:hypothetical protein
MLLPTKSLAVLPTSGLVGETTPVMPLLPEGRDPNTIA